MKASCTLPRTLPLVALYLAIHANADVIYSGLQDLAIPKNETGLYLNVLTGSQSPSPGWHINPTFGGIDVYNSANFQPVREGTSGMDTIRNLAQHAVVSSGSASYDAASGFGVSFDHMGNTFTAGTEGYIGFRVVNGAENNYGWMRVVFTGTGSPVVKDWAYNTGGSSTGVGNVIQSGSTFTLDSTAQNFTLGSAIGGSNSVVKIGSNTATLSGAHGYTGTTTINTGTLAIGSAGTINTSSGVTINGGTFLYNNSSTALSSPVTFTSGTIGGTNLTGSLGGMVIGANQTISPGNGVGTASTTSQTWAGGGTYQFEINNAAGAAGSGWDLLNGSGSLNITATGLSKFNIDISSLGLNEAEINFNDLADYNWLIADFNSVVEVAAEAFDIDATNFSNELAGVFGIARGDTVGGDSTQIFLTYAVTPIPEPRSILLVTLGALALLHRRRS